MLALLLSMSMLVPPTGDWHDLFDKVQGQSVLQVYNMDRETSCTGEMVMWNEVLTADHCVVDYHMEMVVIDQYSTVYPCWVLKLDKVNDLALLECHVPTKRPIALASTNPEIGDEVMSIGDLSKGVDGYVGEVNEVGFYVAMNHPYPKGFSGGPLLNVNGEMVGVNVRTSHWRGFSVPIGTVRAFLYGVK